MTPKMLALAVVCACALNAQSASPPTIAAKTAGLEKLDGYLPLYWDARGGKLWMEIARWNTEFLFYTSLPAGVGSNDLGLDRGRLGNEHVVRFERTGPRVLLVESNYRFRALSDNPEERRAVKDAFAESALWGFQVEAEEDGRALVDATAFFLRDAVDAGGALRRLRQGNYRLEASRSAFYMPRTKNFPRNTEVEVTITLTGDPEGRFVREVTPTADAVTVREHFSFLELPGSGYRPRAFDPRAGYFGIQFTDYAAPLGEPMTKRFISRHRLKKKDPRARLGEPVKPIVYYLDPGTPEPIRSALLDGARWWNQAFEAAGYRDAFRVEMLPPDADPMDARYNLIQWVHRSTRGWSYGASVADPRTGEIIKGHVTLGSLRVRQDYLIAEGLLAPYETGKPAPAAMREMALARLRQLAAHEVGHTLGLAHNYIASSQNRASVMDYPHPLIKLTASGAPDLSSAYETGIGEWDKVSIAYGYQDFPEGTDEKRALAANLDKARARGLTFLTDQDARPEGSSHPQTHLWDNGANAVDELERIMMVRKRALERFSENNIQEGQPLSMLADVLVPVYLSHRYQLEAAAKVLGGMDYAFALRGDGQQATRIVPAAEQRRALDALLKTLAPESLVLSESVLRLIPPRAMGYPATRESFHARTSPAFDSLAAAESAATLAVRLMLTPERAARLVEFNARDSDMPGFDEVLDRLMKATWESSRLPGIRGEIQRTVEMVVLYHLMALAANENASAQARALASWKIEELAEAIDKKETRDVLQYAHEQFALELIHQFREKPERLSLPRPAEPPPGQPIGCDP